MWLGCSVIPRKIVSHVMLICMRYKFPGSLPSISLDSTIYYFSPPPLAISKKVLMRLEEKWPSWTLTVHLAWRQIIPAKYYTPETNYNSKWLRVPSADYPKTQVSLLFSIVCYVPLFEWWYATSRKRTSAGPGRSVRLWEVSVYRRFSIQSFQEMAGTSDRCPLTGGVR